MGDTIAVRGHIFRITHLKPALLMTLNWREIPKDAWKWNISPQAALLGDKQAPQASAPAVVQHGCVSSAEEIETLQKCRFVFHRSCCETRLTGSCPLRLAFGDPRNTVWHSRRHRQLISSMNRMATLRISCRRKPQNRDLTSKLNMLFVFEC